MISCLLNAVVDGSYSEFQGRAVTALGYLKLDSAVLSKLGANILSRLATYQRVFGSITVSDLISAYVETGTDIWLSIIFNRALIAGTAVTLAGGYILTFGEDDDMPDRVKIPDSKKHILLTIFVRSFNAQAEKYGLCWT